MLTLRVSFRISQIVIGGIRVSRSSVLVQIHNDGLIVFVAEESHRMCVLDVGMIFRLFRYVYECMGDQAIHL